MPLLFLSAPGIGTRYSDSYSEHLPAVVRPRKREAIITYKKIRPMIQLDNLSYRLISRHYKIFCVNVKYGIQYGFRIFYLIALQNEENYEREESCSA